MLHSYAIDRFGYVFWPARTSFFKMLLTFVCVSIFSLDRLSAKNSINTVLILWVFFVPSECARTRVFPMKRLFRSFSNPSNGFYIKSACAERVKEQELQHTAKVTMWMQFLAIA